MSESLIVQSNDEGLREIEDFLDRSFDTHHVAHYAATITVPVLQAVQNAIHHGNADDAAKQVRVEVGHCRGGIYFEVEDEGAGFDYEACLSRSANIEQGRGLFLISSLSDRFAFSKGGRCLRMEFNIEGVYADDAVRRLSSLQYFYHREVMEV